MSNEATMHPPSLSHTVLKMIQHALGGGMTFDTITTVLSLLCLLSILQRSHPAEAELPAASPAPVANSTANTADGLQKLLGQLTKSDGGGGSGDALMSLLPLLNNPQIKSKMTPGNIAAILGLINNFGGSGGSGDGKHEKSDKEKQDSKGDGKKDSPAATVTAGADSETPELSFTESTPETINVESESQPSKDKTRYLEWKNNF